jgi:hypothetical protein
MKQITENEFYENFTPVENHLDNNASWDNCMFETYGEEVDYVREQDNNNIWTIVEGDNDTMFIESGFHIVNRMGYLITEEKWDEETTVIIED